MPKNLKLRPLDDKLVVSPQEADKKTPGGIVLPDNAAEKTILRGTVLAAGPGGMLTDGKRAEMPVKPGEMILYQQYAATTVEVDGEEYAIIRQGDILGICE